VGENIDAATGNVVVPVFNVNSVVYRIMRNKHMKDKKEFVGVSLGSN
jgi:hypothetical protein